MMSIKIENPDLPFWDDIPYGLTVGKVIRINGIFPVSMNEVEYSHTRIDLCGASLDAVALHLSIRLNEVLVVRNSFQGGKWEREEREGPFPFSIGRQFTIEILLQPYGYQISVNGHHCWTFAHRLPHTNVTHLNIEGSAIIWAVEYIVPNSQVELQRAQLPVPHGELMQNQAAQIWKNLEQIFSVDNVPLWKHLGQTLSKAGVPLWKSVGLPVSVRNAPYWKNLEQPLSEGSLFKIKTFFPESLDRSQYSQINLCLDSMKTIALHLSIRFNCPVVVRNTRQDFNWELEEREGPFPFALGKEYLIEILVRSGDYQISVNGFHCWTFVHRLPFEKVTSLNIEGPMGVWHVDYMNSEAQPAASAEALTEKVTNLECAPQSLVNLGCATQSSPNLASAPQPSRSLESTLQSLTSLESTLQSLTSLESRIQSPTSPVPICSASRPYWRDLTQTVAVGSTFKMKVFFPASTDASQYSHINLCLDSMETIALHLSIRFNCHVVVRNTRQDFNWEMEEREGPFPFALGKEYLIEILVRSDDYRISVNGFHCWTFVHRLPFEMVTGLNIEGPMNVWHVDYMNSEARPAASAEDITEALASLECTPRSVVNLGSAPESQLSLESTFQSLTCLESRLQSPMSPVPVCRPPLPYRRYLSQTITVGSTFKIKGFFPASADPSKFSQINLSQDSTTTTALHLSIRFEDRVVVRNTKRHGVWESEEREGPFPFALGREFIIEILVLLDSYKISVNGSYCWMFPHRLPFEKNSIVFIEGPINIWNVDYVTNEVQHGSVQQLEPNEPPVMNPPLPYWGNLMHALSVGSTLKIKGFFPHSADISKFPQISLCHNSKGTTALLLKIRFDNSKVVRNSALQSQFNPELRENKGPFPFALGKEFLMEILVQPDAYQISVNGSHCWMFAHRVPFEKVNYLSIGGPLNIYHIDYTNPEANNQSICQKIPLPSYFEPVYNPPVPFSYHINGGIKPGMMIYVSGIPLASYQRFTVDLQCGHEVNPPPDIALRLDVHGYNNIVGRNTHRLSRWELEETSAPYFPFTASFPFDMIILIQNEKYMVAVNGRHFFEYFHRMSRFAEIDTLRIAQDVRITSIRVDA